MRNVIVILLISCVLGQPPVLIAESAGASSDSSPAATQGPGKVDIWDRLPDMRRGTRVRLLLNEGSQITGRLVSARTDAVVVEKNQVRKGSFVPPSGMSLGDPLTFQRADVASVEEQKGWPTWAKVLVWVGIGWVAAGAIIGSIVGNS